jgi:predicted helicase
MNKGQWIRDLIADYKQELDEQKLNLDDDFIKFIRFGQWKIDEAGAGILAFITNNTYLDGITHRRMRQSLLSSFTKIYIFDLHGSVTKGERSPDGGKDENVFDIQQGVAIGLFVRERGKNGPAAVYHADLWGSRLGKYDELSSSDVYTTHWSGVSPKDQYYFFVPKTWNLEAEYWTYVELREAYPVSSPGVKTERDKITIHWDSAGLDSVLEDFRNLDENAIRTKYHLGQDSRDWKVVNAKADVRKHISQMLVSDILYRPFDVRKTWYSGQTRGFIGTPGHKVMKHFLGRENMGLLAKRQSKREPFSYVWCANMIVESCVFESAYANGTFFPLYLYTDATQTAFDTGDAGGKGGRRPNLDPAFIEDVSANLGLRFIPDGKGDLEATFGPEDVFNYIYAIFHSPTYRTRYAEFLKIDFPRLPLTSDVELFRKLCDLGEQLVGLHLMEKQAPPIASYPVPGNNTVEKVSYTEPGQGAEKGRVWINKTQYFEGVPPEVWEFHIGGYQVAHKWLKDRKGRELTHDDIEHYKRIIAALSETKRLMNEIDEAIPGWPLV